MSNNNHNNIKILDIDDLLHKSFNNESDEYELVEVSYHMLDKGVEWRRKPKKTETTTSNTTSFINTQEKAIFSTYSSNYNNELSNIPKLSDNELINLKCCDFNSLDTLPNSIKLLDFNTKFEKNYSKHESNHPIVQPCEGHWMDKVAFLR